MKQRRLFLRHKLNDHLDRGRATWQHDMACRSLRMLASHIVLYLKGVSWNPLASLPMNLDWIHISPQWNRSASTEMMFPYSYRVPSLWWSRHLKFALTKKNSSQCRLFNVMRSKIHWKSCSGNFSAYLFSGGANRLKFALQKKEPRPWYPRHAFKNPLGHGRAA